MNGQPTLKRENRVVGTGRDDVRQVCRDGSEQPPTRKEFDLVVEDLKFHLDNLEKLLVELQTQVTVEGRETLEIMGETMDQLTNTIFCELSNYGPPGQ